MLNTKEIKDIPTETLDNIGFSWHTDEDGSKYISNKLIGITKAEAEAYHAAGLRLYEMFTQAAEHIIETENYQLMDIDPKFAPLIKKSWNEDHWHLYGRFDLAGGIDNQPIKLIEFNADTPTSLFETAIIQHEQMRVNGLDEQLQFNTVGQHLVDNFKRLVSKTDNCDVDVSGKTILFSSIAGLDEDEMTVRLMQELAIEAGFHAEFRYLDEVYFDECGVYDTDEDDRVAYDFWFKLFPWEDIIEDEPELLDVLLEMYANDNCVTEIINPPYTLIFQSKALLPVMAEMFPHDELLLKTSFYPLNCKQVEKVTFGREGANVTILDECENVLKSNAGDYGHRNNIYQEFVEFPRDEEDNCIQAGLFFVYEPCAIAFRSGDEILGNMAKFVGHYIND